MTGRHRATSLALAAAVAIAAVVIALASGGGDDDPAVEARTEAASPPSRSTPVPMAPKPTTPTVIVRDGKPVGGVRRLRVEKGSTISFVVRSDVADEVHLHGYDVAKDVAAGGSVRFSVPATIDGRFVVELEHRALHIAEIDVAP